ncbi:DIMBOA UDP-glucosyltransferase BX9-like isoform X1 [Oryza brachyantha]|uniref:DIMBOA UDP-glucosyltransferase BX9-like isoform X1 n=1 Tax=Oryza brachyantha TaxID=4533 RepID=UPI001ADB0F9A|nr:DIMBOA UDP-glucosyltransferase BX9-like isoform X1 [Oryza brachyantha]
MPIKTEEAAASPARHAGGGDDDGRGRRRVLVFPLPFQGHVTPMLQLADALRSRGGFAVTVFLAPVPSSSSLLHRPAGYRFVTVGAGVAGAAAALIPSGTGGDFAGALMRLDALLRAPFEDCLRQELAADEDAAACLVVDSNLRGMQEVAERLGVATLALRTGGACCLVAYMAFPELCGKGILPPPTSARRDQHQMDMQLDELPPLRLRDMMFSATTTHATMATCLERLLDSSRCSSGVILNTFNDLENSDLQKIANGLNVPVYAVGPLHKISIGEHNSLLTQDLSCLEWLDKQEAESVIYVSFGSLASMDPEEILETAWGLVDSQMPFLWVIRPNMVQGSLQVGLPDGFEEATRGSGMVVSWAPQQDVLKHQAVGGFWTHNGWNSTLESICDGVPMICRPQFADQMINARYVEEVWKIGFELEGKLERGMIERALRKLMCSEGGNEMRQRAKDLKKKATTCVEKGGSSKTAIDMLVNRIMSF